MQHELTFYTNPRSRGRIVRWMLEEVGAPYETEIVEYGDAMRSPAYLAINPMGKVPAVVHRGAVVTECAAIIDGAPGVEVPEEREVAVGYGTPDRDAYRRVDEFDGPMG